jgi:hypothetical protein
MELWHRVLTGGLLACHYDAVPTVEVITAPTDWAAIVSAAVTGVAALAGIAGTAWQAQRAQKASSAELNKTLATQTDNLKFSNAAEQRRAILAQKIRIYAAFQGAVDDIIAVAGRTKQQEGEFGKAQSALLKAAAEVILVAPDEPDDIGELTKKIKHSVNIHIGPSGLRRDADPHGAIERNRDELVRKMKEDLARYEPQQASPDRAVPVP